MKIHSFVHRQSSILLFFLAFMVGVFAWYQYSAYTDLKIAYSGFSAYDWIVIRDNPYIEEIGYSAGLNTYYKSFFMYIYLCANDYLNIPPDMMIPIVQMIEIGIIFLALYIFIRIVFRELEKIKRDIIIFILFLYFIASFALSPELSRFGSPFISGLYYNFADGLRLLSIAFFLRQKYKASGVLLGLSFVTHPIYGLIGAAFLFALLLTNIQLYKRDDYRKVFLGFVIFFLFVITWYILLYPKEIIEYFIPLNEFIHYSLLGNFHWFPIDFGIFKDANYEKFIGFSGIVLLYLYLLVEKKEINKIDRQIFYGLLFLLILTFFGLLVSYYKPSKLLIKLAFARSSLLFMEIAVIYIVYRLVTNIFSQAQTLFKKSMFLLLLFTPYLYQSPYPLLLVIIIVASDVKLFKNRALNEFRIKVRYFLIAWIFIMVFFMIYLYKFDYINMKYFDRYFADYKALYIFVGFIIMLKLNSIISNKRQIIYFTMIGGSIILSTLWLDKYQEQSQAYVDKAKEYMKLQQWVEKNTTKDSLFMIDPTIAYGWRAYSKRASWGSLREFIGVSWLYDENYQNFIEGKRRIKEFDMDTYSKKYKPVTYMGHYWKFVNDIQNKFYSSNKSWFNNLAIKYDINYIVMQKKYIQKDLDFKKVYENSFFILYKI